MPILAKHIFTHLANIHHIDHIIHQNQTQIIIIGSTVHHRRHTNAAEHTDALPQQNIVRTYRTKGHPQFTTLIIHPSLCELRKLISASIYTRHSQTCSSVSEVFAFILTHKTPLENSVTVLPLWHKSDLCKYAIDIPL